VSRHQVGQHVEPGLPEGGEAGIGRGREVPAGQRRHLGQEGPPERVVLQGTVPACAPDRAAAAAVEEGFGPLIGRVGDLGDAVMDLVSGHWRAQCAPPRAAEDLLRAEPYAYRQQPEPVDRTAARLHLVLDLAGQHLVAAADAQYRAAGPGPLGDRGGQAAIPQPGQVGDGGPGAGQHHQVRVG